MVCGRGLCRGLWISGGLWCLWCLWYLDLGLCRGREILAGLYLCHDHGRDRGRGHDLYLGLVRGPSAGFGLVEESGRRRHLRL